MLRGIAYLYIKVRHSLHSLKSLTTVDCHLYKQNICSIKICPFLKHCRAIYLESGLIQVGIVATISKDMAMSEKKLSLVYILLSQRHELMNY